jgi:ATP-binding cassette subfamily B protein
MFRARRGATRIIVSHRLSVLEACDRVLVLDAGRVVDAGTPGELRERPGPYRDAVDASSAKVAS